MTSPLQRANAAFAGRLELLPYSDERVTQFVETPDGKIAVAYTGRTKSRVMLVAKVAGDWQLESLVTVPAQRAVTNFERGILGRDQFHFTEEEHHVARTPLTHHQKALRHYNLLGW